MSKQIYLLLYIDPAAYESGDDCEPLDRKEMTPEEANEINQRFYENKNEQKPLIRTFITHID